jgi:predicted ATPase
MAQLDGEREVVVKLAGEALHVSDEVSTRQWRQWARSLQWWAGEGIEEPEVPGPLLQPYFEMLLADDPLVSAERAKALLDHALVTARATGEQFCEAEILRMRAGVLRRGRHAHAAAADYNEAVAVARGQGARMLELRALTDLATLPGADEHVLGELRHLVSELTAGGPSRSLEEARTVVESP